MVSIRATKASIDTTALREMKARRLESAAPRSETHRQVLGIGRVSVYRILEAISKRATGGQGRALANAGERWTQRRGDACLKACGVRDARLIGVFKCKIGLE